VELGGTNELHAAFLKESRTWSFYISGTKHMHISTREAPLDAVFWFVSGHDFSRAVKDGKRIGLQPLLWRILREMLVRGQAKRKAQGL
jgi:hypothetical protein